MTTLAVTDSSATNARPQRRWGLRLGAIVLALLVCELTLQVATLLSPNVRFALLSPWQQSQPDEIARLAPPQFIPDPLLGVRGNPEFPEHDRLGYRNPQVPASADIVALGDSQTYGVLQPVDQVWPAVLARLTGRTVYNMGIGAWGPVEYGLCVDAALARNPKIVLFGLYFGNDFFDGFRSVYLRGVAPELADPGARPAIAQAEAQGSLLEASGKLFAPSARPPQQTAPSGLVGWLRAGVSDHCRLYAVARLVKNHCGGDARTARAALSDWPDAVAWAARHPQSCSVFAQGPVRTVLTAPHRHVALDLDDPRIAEGLRIDMRALQRAARRCRQRGAQPIVVFLPTKELVFAPFVTNRSAHPYFDAVVAEETRARTQVTRALDEAGIAHIDTLAALRACLQSPSGARQPYPPSTDGHPNVAGHKAIATAIAAGLERLPD